MQYQTACDKARIVFQNYLRQISESLKVFFCLMCLIFSFINPNVSFCIAKIASQREEVKPKRNNEDMGSLTSWLRKGTCRNSTCTTVGLIDPY